MLYIHALGNLVSMVVGDDYLSTFKNVIFCETIPFLCFQNRIEDTENYSLDAELLFIRGLV